MELVKARILGYCMGVRRAVKIAYRCLAAHSCHVYTIGSLIHNPLVLEDIKKRGAKVLEEGSLPRKLSGSHVIVRAHGISPALETDLIYRGGCIVDATCPKVKAIQMQARDLAEKGYSVFLAGEGRHGEIAGIRGYAPGCNVVADQEDARVAAERIFREEPGAKTALIGQTTISPDEYGAIGELIRFFFPKLLVVDTICQATRDRQTALRELCTVVDALIVAGGKESANTRRLFAIAKASGKPAWLVENAGEVPEKAASYRRVGLSAGASTPDELIRAIEEKMMAF
jgi:4-hydroxy-3-methylbut-2-enyl diphosphate reductase